MSLKIKIQEDLKKSMKEKNHVSTLVLRNIISAITVTEKEGKTSNDTDVIRIISKLVKDRKTSIEMFSKGDRADLVEKEQSEIAVLEAYLPKSITLEEITSAIKEIVSAGNYTKSDMGKVMKDFNSKYAGQADGKTVSEVVKSIL